MSSEKKRKGGIFSIGLGGMIFLVFLTLKLAELGQVANWSWWWVTSPLWLIPVVIIGGVIVFVVIVGFIKLLAKIFS